MADKIRDALGIRMANENIGVHEAPVDYESRKRRIAEMKRKNSLIEKMKRQAKSDIHTLGVIGKKEAVWMGKSAWNWLNTPIPSEKKKKTQSLKEPEPLFNGNIKW